MFCIPWAAGWDRPALPTTSGYTAEWGLGHNRLDASRSLILRLFRRAPPISALHQRRPFKGPATPGFADTHHVGLSSDSPAVVLISPDLPPKRGGVADHTWRLLEILSNQWTLGALASPGCEVPPGVTLLPPVANWSDRGAIDRTVGSLPTSTILFWQYVPHMYGRGA